MSFVSSFFDRLKHLVKSSTFGSSDGAANFVGTHADTPPYCRVICAVQDLQASTQMQDGTAIGAADRALKSYKGASACM